MKTNKSIDMTFAIMANAKAKEERKHQSKQTRFEKIESIFVHILVGIAMLVACALIALTIGIVGQNDYETETWNSAQTETTIETEFFV